MVTGLRVSDTYQVTNCQDISDVRIVNVTEMKRFYCEDPREIEFDFEEDADEEDDPSLEGEEEDHLWEEEVESDGIDTLDANVNVSGHEDHPSPPQLHVQESSESSVDSPPSIISPSLTSPSSDQPKSILIKKSLAPRVRKGVKFKPINESSINNDHGEEINPIFSEEINPAFIPDRIDIESDERIQEINSSPDLQVENEEETDETSSAIIDKELVINPPVNEDLQVRRGKKKKKRDSERVPHTYLLRPRRMNNSIRAFYTFLSSFFTH